MEDREKRLEIGRRLAKVRDSRGQRTFAEAVGSVQQSISQYERGRISGSWLFLGRLGERENTDLNELLSGSNREIGEKIKKLRNSRNQGEFADAVGSAQQTISKYERGLIPRSWSFLARLAEEERVDLNWLLAGVPSFEVPDRVEPRTLESRVVYVH